MKTCSVFRGVVASLLAVPLVIAVQNVGASGFPCWDLAPALDLPGALGDDVYTQIKPAASVGVGGDIYVASYQGAEGNCNIWRWDPSFGWSVIGTVSGSVGDQPTSDLEAITTDGRYLYIGGMFQWINGVSGAGMAVTNIARYNLATAQWSDLGYNSRTIESIAVDSLTNIYVGLQNTGGSGQNLPNIGDLIPDMLMMRNYATGAWNTVGGGLRFAYPIEDGFGPYQGITALAADGTNIYVGGNFLGPQAFLSQHVVKWTGSGWAPMTGLQSYSATWGADSFIVTSIAISGTNVFVAGTFWGAGYSNQQPSGVARYSKITGVSQKCESVWRLQYYGDGTIAGLWPWNDAGCLASLNGNVYFGGNYQFAAFTSSGITQNEFGFTVWNATNCTWDVVGGGGPQNWNGAWYDGAGISSLAAAKTYVLAMGTFNQVSALPDIKGVARWLLSPPVPALTASMKRPRVYHTATPMGNGRVLVAGGDSSSSGKSSEYYDPATGTWTLTGSMNYGHTQGAATLLTNVPNVGEAVLVMGDAAATPYAELYDSSSGTWSMTGSMNVGRYSFTATLLNDGTVLVAGGNHGGYLNSAEIYNPLTSQWTYTGTMNNARQGHTATLLNNGQVLVTGGYPNPNTAEVYNPSTGMWTATSPMNFSHVYHTATLLSNGQVLVVGGPSVSGAELYDPATGAWMVTNSMPQWTDNDTATLLPSGQILVAGGTSKNGVTANEWLYDVNSGTWGATGSLNVLRQYHTASLLANGKVLIAGGINSTNVLSAVEIYP